MLVRGLMGGRAVFLMPEQLSHPLVSRGVMRKSYSYAPSQSIFWLIRRKRAEPRLEVFWRYGSGVQ
ncbi:hypothetical protein Poly41_33830 [Novipirellula artificiosorum]|uniref:LysR substrate binding domain protein n=1 Tax=Novipirellula artificiosorum TaxID=2528016 RepID=A0A5C6DM90_9BACT|nr:hypothetical protein Poly41_33830 [Novipirellula artificiosorum]